MKKEQVQHTQETLAYKEPGPALKEKPQICENKKQRVAQEKISLSTPKQSSLVMLMLSAGADFGRPVHQHP